MDLNTCSSTAGFNAHMLITFKVQSHFRWTNTTFCNSALPAARGQRLSVPLPHVNMLCNQNKMCIWGLVGEGGGSGSRMLTRQVFYKRCREHNGQRPCLTWAVTSGRSTSRSCHNPSSSARQCGTQTLLHECHFSVEKQRTGSDRAVTDRCWGYSGEAPSQRRVFMSVLTKDHENCERNTALCLASKYAPLAFSHPSLTQ